MPLAVAKDARGPIERRRCGVDLASAERKRLRGTVSAPTVYARWRTRVRNRPDELDPPGTIDEPMLVDFAF